MIKFTFLITLISTFIVSCATTKGMENSFSNTESSFAIQIVPQKYTDIHSYLQGNRGQQTNIKSLVKLGGQFHGGIRFIDLEKGTIVKSMPEYTNCEVSGDNIKLVCVNEQGWYVFDRNNIIIQSGNNPKQNHFPVTECGIALSIPDQILVNEIGSVFLQQFGNCIIAINIQTGGYLWHKGNTSGKIYSLKNKTKFLTGCYPNGSKNFHWCLYDLNSGAFLQGYNSDMEYGNPEFPLLWEPSEDGSKVVYTRSNDDLKGLVSLST